MVKDVEMKFKKDKKDRKEKKDKKDKKDKKEKPEIKDDSSLKKRKAKEDEAEVKKKKEDKVSSNETSFVPTIGEYTEHPDVQKLTESDIQAYHEKNSITYSGDKQIKPILDFNYANFPPKLLEFCKGFDKPTPIQSSCWPIILSKRDVIGIAQTGSGKTLAFTLPAIMHLQTGGRLTRKTPSILVLAPTRELAMQTQEVCEKVGKFYNFKSVCIYGGVPKQAQKDAIRGGVQVVIATPGRLLDLVEEGALDISQVTYMVLDEADRMLDFGFEPAIRSTFEKISKTRQTVMFSATWPETIRKLANTFLSNPITITIGSEDLAVSHNVQQIVEVLDDPYKKESRLMALLNQYHKQRDNRIIIFVLYKKEAVRVESNLRYKGYNVKAIQGDLNQHQRTDALAKFKDGTCPLLIATDVAARGLDIPKVEYVINYTFPLTIDDYVHRIGRTGRAGNKGISHTFFTPHDKAHSGELINVLKSANMDVPQDLMKFGTTVKKKEHKTYGAFFKEVDPNAKPTRIVFDD